jgi:regulator of protease activity HflC (stomatin/prohibitin superfamily)
VDVHDKLDELISVVENARSMPMSASCIINRGEVLATLEEVRALLPEEFRHAQLLLADRESVVDEGRREAAKIISRAEDERLALTAETEVAAEAQRQAARIRHEAAEEARTMRAEVDDYVDTKLANFEVVLDKTLAAVQRGREKLRGRTSHQDLAGSEDQPLEPHPFDTADPA